MPPSTPLLLFLVPIMIPLLLVFSLLNAVSDFISRMTELPTHEDDNMQSLKNENAQPLEDVDVKIIGSFLNCAMSEGANLVPSEDANLETSEGAKLEPSEGVKLDTSEGVRLETSEVANLVALDDVDYGFWENVRVPTPEAVNSNQVLDNSNFSDGNDIHDDKDVSETNSSFIDFDEPKDEDLLTNNDQTPKLDDMEQAQAILKPKNVKLLSAIKSLEEDHSSKLSSFLAKKQLWNDKLSLLAQSHIMKIKKYEADEEAWNGRLKALVMKHYNSRKSHEEDERAWKAKAKTASAYHEKKLLSLQTQQQALEEKLESLSQTYDSKLASLQAQEQTLQGLSTAYDSKIAEFTQKERDLYRREEEMLWCLDRLSNVKYPTPIEDATSPPNSTTAEDLTPEHFAQTKESSSDLVAEGSSSPISVLSFLSQPPPSVAEAWGQTDTEDHDFFVKPSEIEKEVEKEKTAKETRRKRDQYKKKEAAWKKVALEPQTERGKEAILTTEELTRLVQDFLSQRRVIIGAQQYRRLTQVPQVPCMNEPSEKGEVDEIAQAPEASQCGSTSATNDNSAYKPQSKSIWRRHALKKKTNAHIRHIGQAKQLEESINFTIREKLAKLKESGDDLVGVKQENGQIVVDTNLLMTFTWASLEIDRLERFLDLRDQIDKFEAEGERKAVARKERLATKEALTQETSEIDIEEESEGNSEVSFDSSTSGGMPLPPAPVRDVATRDSSFGIIDGSSSSPRVRLPSIYYKASLNFRI